jgi:hypothetical protein
MAKTITKTEQAEVLFLSNGAPELRLIRKPRVPKYSHLAEHIGDEPGVRYQFDDHQLRIKPGQDKLPDGPLDDDGEPTVQDALAWLRSHPGFNGSEKNAFHEHGAEVGRVPEDGPVLQEIQNAAIFGQVDRLEEILAEERSTHQRQRVIEQAEAALETVNAALASTNPSDES